MKKYGRTYHLKNSPSVASDDKVLQNLSALSGADEVVFTEKMDGENTTIHSSGCHARSIDSGYQASRDWLKAFAAGISPSLASNERIIGEYLYARHSVEYAALPSYFLGFAWIMDNVFQNWDATLQRFSELGISSVPVLCRGKFDQKTTEEVIASLDSSRQEGFVVRTIGAYRENDMATHMAKYVRANHVKSEKHWMHQEIIKNKLA
ncbi:MAG: RNA ligase family protein [Pseudomonadota bacterium]